MDYALQNRNAPAQQGRISGANATREMPRLAERLEHLGKLLAICHEGASNVEQAAVRLTGPRPEPARAGDAQTSPAAETIEQKLQALIMLAEHLASRLQNATAHLDSAV